MIEYSIEKPGHLKLSGYISMTATKIPIKQLVAEIEEGSILIPEIQRGFVWDEERMRKFITSIITGLPIPPIIIMKLSDGYKYLIDGQQRVKTILFFLGKEDSVREQFVKRYGRDYMIFPLKEIQDVYTLFNLSSKPSEIKKVVSAKGGRSINYHTFSEDFVRWFKNIDIPVIEITLENDRNLNLMEQEKIMSEIFVMINEGSMKLSRMELWTVLYGHKVKQYTRSLSDIVDEWLKIDEQFRGTAYSGMKRKRKHLEALVLLFDGMVFGKVEDVGGTLKYNPMTFTQNSWKGNTLSDFEQYIYFNRSKELSSSPALESKHISQLTGEVLQVIKTAYEVFGSFTFRNLVTAEDGRLTPAKEINTSIFVFETMLIHRLLKEFGRGFIVNKKDDILNEAFIYIMRNVLRFSSRTSTKVNILKILRDIDYVIRNIQSTNASNMRSSERIKKLLWDYFKKVNGEKNPVCPVCGHEIPSLEVADLDHVQRYSEGGKTVVINLRFKHKHCNRSYK